MRTTVVQRVEERIVALNAFTLVPHPDGQIHAITTYPLGRHMIRHIEERDPETRRRFNQVEKIELLVAALRKPVTFDEYVEQFKSLVPDEMHPAITMPKLNVPVPGGPTVLTLGVHTFEEKVGSFRPFGYGVIAEPELRERISAIEGLGETITFKPDGEFAVRNGKADLYRRIRVKFYPDVESARMSPLRSAINL